MMNRSFRQFFAVIAVLASLAAATAAANSSLGGTDWHTSWLPLVLRLRADRQIDEYGLNFVSAVEDPSDFERYSRAVSTGAGWNRWPLYWYNVETSPDQFDWSRAEAVITADRAAGLKTEIILMGTPWFYASGGNRLAPLPEVGQRAPEESSRAVEISTASTVPVGLYLPVFSDGTDQPATGKAINPANKWACFVNGAVAMYGPLGITHWEIWNEPDYSFFWTGTPPEYARLLKVAYLSARQADPAAQILFGGLANFQQPGFLAEVLAVLSADPQALASGYFFDVLATHSYSYSWESWYQVWRAGRTLQSHSLSKSIWLNESGSPAWDDYPGPTWDPASGYRSTMMEGASYVLQSALYARYAGAEVVFHFQLYDDCGNQPAGTDFPPNDGSWCQTHEYCAGDAYGLLRNPVTAACFTQHPAPNTARPVFDAYRVLTDHLYGLEPLWRLRPGGSDPYNGPQEWIAFYRASTGERVLGLWARSGVDETATVQSTGTSAQLLARDGTVTSLTPFNGQYTVVLEKATNRNLDHDRSVYAIGGAPLILVERDTLPPEAAISPLGSVVAPAFVVSWTGQDLGSGMKDYDVYVSVDGGPLELWLDNTTQMRASYSGTSGSRYGFAVAGRDRAGNQAPAPTVPQVEVKVGSATFLPLMMVSGDD
jgi:hypothetical protein